MSFPRLSMRAVTGVLAAAFALAACSGGQGGSPTVPSASSNGVKTMGAVPTGAPSATPAPTPTPSNNLTGPYCGGYDRDDCFAFRFILPLRAKVAGGALNLSVDDDGFGLPCLIYVPENRFAFTVNGDTDASVSTITQKDYCAFFENIGIDGVKRQGVIPIPTVTPTPSPTPTAAPTDTPSPTPEPTAKPGKLYIVEVSMTCKSSSGDHGDGFHRFDSRSHGDDDDRDDHDCDPHSKTTLIGAIAGPGVRDGAGHITFQAIPNSLHFSKNTRYWFFLAKYQDDEPNVPHF